MFSGKYLLADNQPPAAKRIKHMLPSDHISVIIYISLIVFIEQAHINVKFLQLCVCLLFCPYVHRALFKGGGGHSPPLNFKEKFI